MAKKIVVVGAGGFAREAAFLLRDINAAKGELWQFAGYVVSDMNKLSDRDSRNEVVGDLDWLATTAGKSVHAVAIGIGTPAVRIEIGTRLQAMGLELPALIHPSVHIDLPSSSIGQGVLLCAGVLATVNVRLQDFAMCNLACTVGHEADIGRGCVLNPTVNISGGVVLEDGVLVGTGAQILQYVRVGRGATVGAGAVVRKDVEAGTTVAGVPAKLLH